MRQHKSPKKHSPAGWVGVAVLVAAATGVALYSVNRATPSTSSLPRPTAATPAMQAPSPVAPPVAGAPATVPQQSASTPASAAVGGATYFIDPVTKESHSPTAEEVQALAAAGPIGAAAVSQPEPIVGIDGIPGVRLTDEQMIYSVATKNPDGSVSIGEATGKTAADQSVRAPLADGSTTKKGALDVQ